MGLVRALAGAVIAIVIAMALIGGLAPRPLPPTLVAEDLAYQQFGSVCPRGVPRSDVCRVIFGQVEREYLANRPSH